MDYFSLTTVILPFTFLLTTVVVTKYLGALIPLKLFYGLKNLKLPFVFNARLAIGTLAAIYGLRYGMINNVEYSILLGIVVLSNIPVALALNRLPRTLAEEPI